MAEGWREVAIGEIADVVGGSTPSTKEPDNFDGGVPWLTPRDLSGPHDRYVGRGERDLSRKGLDSCSAKLLPTNSVLLSTRAPIGYVALAKNPIATNQGFRSLVVQEGVSPEYLYYWLVHNTEELERHASGSTFKELSGSALKSIRLRIPPLDEQQAIAHVLGTLDDKIELNRRMSETLKATARALFRSWFVDFEPIRAKMEGRWRPGESLPALPAYLHPIFPDRLVPSELGNIPEGWELQSMANLADVVYGAPFASKRFNDSGTGLPLIRIRDLATSDPSVFTDEQHPKGHLIEPGDIVVGMDGEFRVYIWQGSPAWLNQRVCYFRPKQGVPRGFLFESLRAPLAELERAVVGTTVIHLGKRHIDSIKLLRPSEAALDAFGEVTAPVFSSTVAKAMESRTFATLRDTLLPQLVTGEIRLNYAGTRNRVGDG